MDHAREFDLPPLLARFEHFLATKGRLGRAVGAVDPELPTRAKNVPAYPIESVKHRYSCLMTLVPALTEMGYLTKAEEPGRWVSVHDRDLRDVSARQIADYFVRRYPPDRCRTHTKGCTRCCLPCHVSMYNKTCEAFRKMAEWLYFEERLYDKPVWSKGKLAEVYAVARVVRLKEQPPEMNDVARVLAFRAWLMDEAEAPPFRTRAHGDAYERALALYEKLGSAKEVAARLKVPYTTVCFWIQGQRQPGGPSKIRAEMPRLYGWSLWFLTEIGARYEEMVHAEFPLEGPFARWDPRAGTVSLIGKGKWGGKPRTVTLTKEQGERMAELVAWRTRLGAVLREWTGHDPAPRLFVTLADSPTSTGNALRETPGPWNATLRRWAERFNEHVEGEGEPERALDISLVSSHKAGRAVSITKLALAGVSEKVIMEERGIDDHATVERYIRLDREGKRGVLEAAEQTLARRANGNPQAADDGVNGAVLEELRSLRKTVEELRAEIRGKDEELRRERERARELTDRLLGAES
ncbi:MAG TPA: hypothetical protein VEY12_05435 [Thermoplasmata archaeon]|nr:hypothetical protein [Thermoplasmata archaeon]